MGLNRRKIGRCLLLGVALILCAFFSFNLYILTKLNQNEVESGFEDFEKAIISNVKDLNHRFWEANPEYSNMNERLQLMFKERAPGLWKTPAVLWNLANNVSPLEILLNLSFSFNSRLYQWPEDNRIYPLYEPIVGEVIRAMQVADIQQVSRLLCKFKGN